MKFSHSITLAAAAVTLSLAAPMAARPYGKLEDAPANRRGIAFNDASLVHLFNTPGSKTTWKYNWWSLDNGNGRNGGTAHEFVPMLHSDRPDHTGPWAAAIDRCVNVGPASAQFPTHVLSFNEPDLCGGGGACMQSTRKAVAAHKQHVDSLRKYGDRIKIGSPAVTNQGAPWGLTWLKVFLQQSDGCKIDFIAIHWYDAAWNTEYFKQHIRNARAVANGRPIWITEFGPRGSEAEVEAFLKEVLPWLDSQADVHRYAMQMAAPGSLVTSGGNGLSAVGNVYNTY